MTFDNERTFQEICDDIEFDLYCWDRAEHGINPDELDELEHGQQITREEWLRRRQFGYVGKVAGLTAALESEVV